MRVSVITPRRPVPAARRGNYSPFGLVNQLLVASGLERVNFLGAEHARLSISVVIVWAQVGLFSLMFSAGLKAIPEEVREAAAIDGASGWVRFWRITLPLLNPTLLLVVIVSTVAAFRAFDVVHVLTGGGPSYPSTSLLVYVYEDSVPASGVNWVPT